MTSTGNISVQIQLIDSQQSDLLRIIYWSKEKKNHCDGHHFEEKRERKSFQIQTDSIFLVTMLNL